MSSVYDCSSYLILVAPQSESDKRVEKRSIQDQLCSKDAVTVNYTEEVKNGYRCYTAAELQANTVTEGYVFTIGDSKLYGGFFNAPLEADKSYWIYIAVKVDVEVSKVV